jgi:hypothetical protein
LIRGSRAYACATQWTAGYPARNTARETTEAGPQLGHIWREICDQLGQHSPPPDVHAWCRVDLAEEIPWLSELDDSLSPDATQFAGGCRCAASLQLTV